jgi:hypothetical protein
LDRFWVAWGLHPEVVSQYVHHWSEGLVRETPAPLGWLEVPQWRP